MIIPASRHSPKVHLILFINLCSKKANAEGVINLRSIIKNIVVLIVMPMIILITPGCNGDHNTINTSGNPSSSVGTPGNSLHLTATQIVNAQGNEGFLSSNPARIGVTIAGTMAVLPFTQYPTLEATGELYTVKLTLLEIMRGENALEYLTEFGLFAGFPYYKSLPGDGEEYLLATVKFEYYMRDLPGNLIYKMGQGDFMTYSETSFEYNIPFILPWKSDIWDYDITPGDSIEIKIAILVHEDDNKPAMLFKKGDKWLGLY